MNSQICPKCSKAGKPIWMLFDNAIISWSKVSKPSYIIYQYKCPECNSIMRVVVEIISWKEAN